MKSLHCILPILAVLATAVCSAPVLPTPTASVEATATLGPLNSLDKAAREAGGASDARAASNNATAASQGELRYMGSGRTLSLAVSDYMYVSAGDFKVKTKTIKTTKTKTTTSTTSTVTTTVVSTGTTTLSNLTPPVTSTYTTTYATTYTTVVRSAAGPSHDRGVLQKAALFASLVAAASFAAGMA